MQPTVNESAGIPMLARESAQSTGALERKKPGPKPKPKPEKQYKNHGDGRLLPGEVGYCAWCRSSFTPLRVYSKPQYFCKPFCNHTWHNHQRYLMMAEFFKQAGKPLLRGQIKALQIEAERALHGASGLKANELVRIKPSSGPIAGCRNHK